MKYIIDIEGEGIYPIQDTERIMPFLESARIHVFEEKSEIDVAYHPDEAMFSRNAEDIESTCMGIKQIAYMDLDEDMVSEWEGVFYRFKLELPEDSFSWQHLKIEYYTAEFWEWKQDMILDLLYEEKKLHLLPADDRLKLVKYYKFDEFYHIEE